MRKKLSIFMDTHIMNKEELLYSLSAYREHCISYSGEEEGWSQQKRAAVIALLDQFINRTEDLVLPELGHWWYYDYDFNRFDVSLVLCHCEKIEYDDDMEEEMTTDQLFTLLCVPCDMLSISEFAQRQNVAEATVRRWIRRGKLKTIQYLNKEWKISCFADRPMRNYEPSIYELGNQALPIAQQFPLLKGHSQLYIRKSGDGSGLFDLILGAPGSNDCKAVQICDDERERLELALLANPGVEVQEIWPSIRFVPNKQHSELPIPSDKISKPIHPAHLDYGSVLVVKGSEKGRIGYYDDDDQYRAIVYFGDPLLMNRYSLVKYSYIQNIIPTMKIIERIQSLYRQIFGANSSIKHQNDLLFELNFCSNLLNDRYMKSMNSIHENKNGYVFISHATYDLSFARALASDLMDEGLSVFLDDWSIDHGENIISRISESISDSHSLIMLISESYLKSVFCNDEWTAFYMCFAKQKKDSIYPIILDESNPPALLSAIKYVRIHDSDDYCSCLEKLLKAIAKHNAIS